MGKAAFENFKNGRELARHVRKNPITKKDAARGLEFVKQAEADRDRRKRDSQKSIEHASIEAAKELRDKARGRTSTLITGPGLGKFKPTYCDFCGKRVYRAKIVKGDCACPSCQSAGAFSGELKKLSQEEKDHVKEQDEGNESC